MSELQGPRILGEERSGRRRSLWWIIAGVVALLPLALLIPFACQVLRRGSDSQGRGSGAQQTTRAQDVDRVQGGGRQAAGEGQQPAGIEEATDAQAAGGASGAALPTGQLASIGQVRSADGRTVTVPRATISGADGRITTHQYTGGEPKVSQCLRHAPLRAGENPNVEVELDRPVASSQRMYAMEPFQYAVSSEEAGGEASGEPAEVEGGRNLA